VKQGSVIPGVREIPFRRFSLKKELLLSFEGVLLNMPKKIP
jgi:hypothetical protein